MQRMAPTEAMDGILARGREGKMEILARITWTEPWRNAFALTFYRSCKGRGPGKALAVQRGDPRSVHHNPRASEPLSLLTRF